MRLLGLVKIIEIIENFYLVYRIFIGLKIIKNIYFSILTTSSE